jgi:hypothetical protein
MRSGGVEKLTDLASDKQPTSEMSERAFDEGRGISLSCSFSTSGFFVRAAMDRRLDSLRCYYG